MFGVATSVDTGDLRMRVTILATSPDKAIMPNPTETDLILLHCSRLSEGPGTSERFLA